MRRREFITLLGGAATWPLAARAQQPAVPVIGFLNTRGPADDAHFPPLVAAFRQGLAGMGYVEGSNVKIEYRWAEGRNERLPELVADLVQRQVSVIAANSQATVAAKAATSTIPIVFITGADPVQVGFVTSLRRPGGNLTGVTSLDTELNGKRLQMLRELLPDARTVAALFNPTFPGSDIQTTDLQAASSALGLRLHVLHASTVAEIDAVVETAVRLQADGLVIANDPFFNGWGDQLGALAFRHRLPAIYEFHPFVAAGGLMSYGGSLTELYRLVGTYTGRILKGEKPADLPVQQATKVELIINLKAAKALGVAVPTALLVRANEVIERNYARCCTCSGLLLALGRRDGMSASTESLGRITGLALDLPT